MVILINSVFCLSNSPSFVVVRKESKNVGQFIHFFVWGRSIVIGLGLSANTQILALYGVHLKKNWYRCTPVVNGLHIHRVMVARYPQLTLCALTEAMPSDHHQHG